MKRMAGERLEDLPLDVLLERHPEVWSRVAPVLLGDLTAGRVEAVSLPVAAFRAEADLWRRRVAESRGNPNVVAAARPHLVAERLAVLTVRRAAESAAVGQATGTYRLSFLSGKIVQALLFRRGLERKPASMALFRLLWPLVPRAERRRLMPLVQGRGIYCFYSRELVRELARMIGARPCLELAAGDGTLARFLRAEGVDVRAVDDHSWADRVSYPADVEKLDAAAALDRYRPRAVVCSWPPPGNRFERRVFALPSVELYVVVGSRHPHAAGDPSAYDRPEGFTGGLDARLSSLVLPPELDPAVLVFRRVGAASS